MTQACKICSDEINFVNAKQAMPKLGVIRETGRANLKVIFKLKGVGLVVFNNWRLSIFSIIDLKQKVEDR